MRAAKAEVTLPPFNSQCQQQAFRTSSVKQNTQKRALRGSVRLKGFPEDTDVSPDQEAKRATLHLERAATFPKRKPTEKRMARLNM